MEKILKFILLLCPLSLLFSEVQNFKPLFNGKSLSGWNAMPGGKWEVRNDAILGTSKQSEKKHGILLSDRKYSDFIIKIKFRVNQGNSGFYFRTEKVKSAVSVNGFQVEVDNSQKTGGLYETGGRKWVCQPSRQAIEKRKYTPGEWTDLKLRAVGRNILLKINGVVCSELINDPGRTQEYFGLQLHGNQEMSVEYRDILIKEL